MHQKCCWVQDLRIAFPSRHNSVITQWRNTASTSWAKRTPGDCNGEGKHGGRKLKIKTPRFPRAAASQSDAIHQNQSALRNLMLMKSGTPAFICSRLRHASGNLCSFFLAPFFFFFPHTCCRNGRARERRREEGGAKIQGHKVSRLSQPPPTVPHRFLGAAALIKELRTSCHLSTPTSSYTTARGRYATPQRVAVEKHKTQQTCDLPDVRV